MRRGRPRPHLDGDLPPLPLAADARRAGPGGPAPAGSRRPASPCGPPTATTPARWRTRPGPRPSLRADRSSRGPNSVAASPETTIVPTKNSAGTSDAGRPASSRRAITTQVDWSIRLSASTTTRSVSPPWATTSAGVWLADPARAGLPVHQAQADPQHLPDPPLREPHAGVVRHRHGAPAGAATMPTAGQNGSPMPSTRSAHSHGSTAPSRPSSTSTRNMPTARQAEPRVVGGQPEDLAQRPGAAAARAAAAGRPWRHARSAGDVGGPTRPSRRPGAGVVRSVVGRPGARRRRTGRPASAALLLASSRAKRSRRRAAARPRPPRRRPARRPRRSGAPTTAGARSTMPIRSRSSRSVARCTRPR